MDAVDATREFRVDVALDTGVVSQPPEDCEAEDWPAHVHDPAAWLARFATLARTAPHQLKRLRVAIQHQTFRCVEQGAYPHPCGHGAVVLNLPLLRGRWAATTTLVHSVPEGFAPQPRFATTRVVLLQGDCVEGAQWCVVNGLCERVALLNMANRSTPGGGFRGGAGAQEENLMRRSNYFESIEDRGDLVQGGAASRRYPLPLEGCIVSQRVCFFRGAEARGYPFLSEPLFFGVVACAALSRPRLVGAELCQEDAQTTLNKMRCILYAAFSQGYDGVVLSAFGCGAFRNPPSHIAALFRIAVREYEGCFRCVAFAIFEDHNSARNVEGGNVAPFARVLGVEPIVLP